MEILKQDLPHQTAADTWYLNWYLLPVIALLLGVSSGQVHARDDKAMYSVADAMATPTAEEIFTGDIQFFFGDDNHPPIGKNLGNYQSNKKANGVGRSDLRVCQRAFLSAMKSLRDRARLEGGNAVVNIISYYRRNRISSTSEFECGSGAIMSGVTLRGDVVTLQ